MVKLVCIVYVYVVGTTLCGYCIYMYKCWTVQISSRMGLVTWMRVHQCTSTCECESVRVPVNASLSVYLWMQVHLCTCECEPVRSCTCECESIPVPVNASPSLYLWMRVRLCTCECESVRVHVNASLSVYLWMRVRPVYLWMRVRPCTRECEPVCVLVNASTCGPARSSRTVIHLIPLILTNLVSGSWNFMARALYVLHVKTTSVCVNVLWVVSRTVCCDM